MSNQAKHTPGPWTQGMQSTFERHNASNVYDKNGNCIATIPGIPLHCSVEELLTSDNEDDREGMANARLIAAAPDLLAALNQIASDDRTPSNIAAIARVALSKARGE